MTEYRTISFMWETEKLLGKVPNGAASNTLDFGASVPDLAENMDGWEVINTQIIPAGQYCFQVFTLRTKVNADSLTVNNVDA